MSIFSDTPTTEVETATTTTEDNQDFVSQVVAAKGEQWNDPQALAKGYLHAQKTIEELKAKEAEFAQQDYAKKLLEQLKAGKQDSAPAADTAPVTPSGTETANTTPSSVDLEALVAEAVTKKEKERTATQNVAEAERQMRERFGTQAGAVLNQRAAELGMDKARLEAMAAESPKAFLALVGQPAGNQSNSIFNSTTTTPSQGQERNREYYDNLRRTDRKKFYSSAIQKQRMQDKARLGDNF